MTERRARPGRGHVRAHGRWARGARPTRRALAALALASVAAVSGCVVEVPIGQDGGPASPPGQGEPGAEGGPQNGAGGVEPVEPTEQAAAAEALVLELANRSRTDHGLEPLERHEDLAHVARSWSAHLAGEGADLAHNPDVADQVPSGWRGVGENVGWVDEGGRWSAERVAEHVHEGWMDSEGHRENILREDWTHLGVGVAHHDDHGWYLTQVFATY